MFKAPFPKLLFVKPATLIGPKLPLLPLLKVRVPVATSPRPRVPLPPANVELLPSTRTVVLPKPAEAIKARGAPDPAERRPPARTLVVLPPFRKRAAVAVSVEPTPVIVIVEAVS